MDFIHSLCKCSDVDLFKNKSIQILLTAQQENWLWMDWVAFFMPQILQLLVFFYWSNIVIPNLDSENESFGDMADVCEFLLVVISIYDLIMEIPIFIKLKH